MDKGRLEAFSDGVIAVAITIMVLDLHPPHSADPAELLPLLPTFFTYVLSFVNVGIYWVNHHHFFHAIKHVSGGMLWANNNLLFWLTLMPFTTAWMGENHFTTWPVLFYGIDLLACGFAYSIMTLVAVRTHGPDSEIARAIGRDKKGRISVIVYLISLPLTFISPIAACCCYLIVAFMWLVPDRRIERVVIK